MENPSNLQRVPLIVTPDMVERDPGGRLRMKGRWGMRCVGRDNVLKWDRKWNNLIVDEALNLFLNTFYGATAKSTLYIGLKGTGTVAAADTMASHAGWAEITSYDEAARQTAVFGTAAAGVIDNFSSVATFTLSTTVSIYGAFTSTDSTKGGATGTLISAGNFGTVEEGDDGDTLEISVDYSAADDNA